MQKHILAHAHYGNSRLIAARLDDEIDLGTEPALPASEELLFREAQGFEWRVFVMLLVMGFCAVLFLWMGLLSVMTPSMQEEEGRLYTEAASPANGEASENEASDLTDLASPASKSDRVAASEEIESSRKIIAVNTTIRDGEREIIKVRSHAFVKAGLAQLREEKFAEQIPPFDPLNMFPETQTAALDAGVISDAIYQPEENEEVSLAILEFPASQLILPPELTLSRIAAKAAIQSYVIRFAGYESESGSDNLALWMAYNSEPGPDQAGVRIIAENMSVVSKQERSGTRENSGEKIIPIDAQTSVLDALTMAEFSPEDVLAVSNALQRIYSIEQLQEGHIARIAWSQDPDTASNKLERISLYFNGEHLASIARTDSGRFVSTRPAAPHLNADTFRLPRDIVNERLTIYESLYQTALAHGLQPELIEAFLHIFAFDIDFSAPVSSEDSLELFYSMPEGEDNGAGEIVYARLQLEGQEMAHYAFRLDAGNPVEYFDDKGRSAKKFLIEKPIVGGRFTSGYGMRRHPVLGYRKMHHGVDWAARRGTPILAAGDGLVVKARWVSGYGRRVEIRHSNGYVSTYSHMTRFAKGVKPGAKVIQGQVIGYVGSTGLSTGPHLHYEILFNGRFVNPMGIKLPRVTELNSAQLESFHSHRQQIDAVMQRAALQ